MKRVPLRLRHRSRRWGILSIPRQPTVYSKGEETENTFSHAQAMHRIEKRGRYEPFLHYTLPPLRSFVCTLRAVRVSQNDAGPMTGSIPSLDYFSLFQSRLTLATRSFIFPNCASSPAHTTSRQHGGHAKFRRCQSHPFPSILSSSLSPLMQ